MVNLNFQMIWGQLEWYENRSFDFNWLNCHSTRLVKNHNGWFTINQLLTKHCSSSIFGRHAGFESRRSLTFFKTSFPVIAKIAARPWRSALCLIINICKFSQSWKNNWHSIQVMMYTSDTDLNQNIRVDLRKIFNTVIKYLNIRKVLRISLP